MSLSEKRFDSLLISAQFRTHSTHILYGNVADRSVVASTVRSIAIVSRPVSAALDKQSLIKQLHTSTSARKQADRCLERESKSLDGKWTTEVQVVEQLEACRRPWKTFQWP